MIAIYPGSFDPITNGHLDIIKRAAEFSDKLIVAALINNSKNSLFSLNEKLEMITEATKEYKNIEVDSFSGLLTDFARSKNCSIIIRGLRAISDFDYEMQLAMVNNRLSRNIETLFLSSNSDYTFLSSSIVKEISMFGGDVSSFVPKNVEKELLKKFERGIYSGGS